MALFYSTGNKFVMVLALSSVFNVVSANQISLDKLKTLDLASLLNITIKTASGVDEKLFDAPATMVVVTAEQITQRGYHHLTEVLQDLPGFDVTVQNGPVYSISYQRGYRLPIMSRTLLMIDGVVDNLLWSQEATLSRQYPLSNIKRIEVLYGPASAVYGPNAFLGVINLITYDGSELDKGEIKGEVNALMGSFNSRGVDVTLRGRPAEELSFSLAAKLFHSDEDDLTGRWGFTSAAQLANRDIWGAILDLEHQGKPFGEYHDPTKDYGVIANVNYKGLKLGVIHWRYKEGYGAFYATDRVQPNTFWNKDNDQYYVDYKNSPNELLTLTSHLSYQETRHYGYWAEAEPDRSSEDKKYSHISLTQWNSVSNRWLFKQDVEYQISEPLFLLMGLKYQRSELTKGYDVPGYWPPAFSSTAEPGSAIGHSTDAFYQVPPSPSRNISDSNLITTRDIGGYVQATFNKANWRFNTGVRYDENSIYGSVVNPRSSVIYHYDDNWTFKLLHGRAFQEPSALQLWGGWSGRLANENLKPERVQNIEAVIMHRQNQLLHELSIYNAHYSDVIKEESENGGERDIFGLEYRLQTLLKNPLYEKDIDLYFNYSYARPKSRTYYDYEVKQWRLGTANSGDIARHKWNVGFNVPFSQNWNFNIRANYIGKRDFYLRNPLRQDKTMGNYFVLNSALTYRYNPFSMTFKVLNLLDREYLHSGPEIANAGDDFSQRSQGYQNSLIPQAGRSFWLNVRWDF